MTNIDNNINELQYEHEQKKKKRIHASRFKKKIPFYFTALIALLCFGVFLASQSCTQRRLLAEEE
jgi:hypothetical protein